MKRRSLGNGLDVSALGLGCMGMSEFYGATNDEESLRVLHRAVELGITFFDTADIYGPHHNEELLARFIREHRQRSTLEIATKCGLVRSSDPTARALDSSPAYIRSACEASLKRLGIDCIDLYYLHRCDGRTPIEEVMGAFEELKQAGKIRHVGLSEVSEKTLRAAHAAHPITALQTEYSLWTREVESAVLPACAELNIGFVPHSPLGRGFLTGTYTADTVLPSADFRSQMPRFQQEALAINLRIVDAVKSIAAGCGATPAQIAIAWLLTRSPGIVPIPGTKQQRYLEDNVGSLDITLDHEALARLDAVLAEHSVTGERYGEIGMATLDS